MQDRMPTGKETKFESLYLGRRLEHTTHKTRTLPTATRHFIRAVNLMACVPSSLSASHRITGSLQTLPSAAPFIRLQSILTNCPGMQVRALFLLASMQPGLRAIATRMKRTRNLVGSEPMRLTRNTVGLAIHRNTNSRHQIRWLLRADSATVPFLDHRTMKETKLQLGFFDVRLHVARSRREWPASSLKADVCRVAASTWCQVIIPHRGWIHPSGWPVSLAETLIGPLIGRDLAEIGATIL